MISDLDLIELVRKNDNKSLQELVTRHERLYFKMALKYLKIAEIRGFNFDDEKYHFFYQVAKDYDAKRGMKFSSFLASRARFLCKTLASMPQRETELKDEHPELEISNDDAERIIVIRSRIENIKDKRAKKILILRYFDKSGSVLPFAKIAPRLKMSTRNVKYLHDRFIKLIKNSSKNV